jgi:hypothetical protein
MDVNNLRSVFVAVLAVSLLASAHRVAAQVQAVGYGGARPEAPTGPTPKLSNGKVDFNGAWMGVGPNSDIEKNGGLKPGELESLMLPAAKALFAKRKGLAEDPHDFCLPDGVPRLPDAFPIRIVQNYTDRAPTHLFILIEGNIHTFRQVFMDGRKHPAELDPNWYGHSIGSFEGDTLVIDTVGLNDKFWFDRLGHPHTEQLHVIERMTRTDLGHLTNKVTIDDPGAYTKPFTLTFNAKLAPGDELLEYICQENNQFGLPGGHPNPYAGGN